jgi:hypothetical protein
MIRRSAPPDVRLMAVLIIAAVVIGILIGYWIYAALS